MSAAFLQPDEPDQQQRIRVCERCGKEKPTERINGEERCAACDAAINAGEPLRRDAWLDAGV
jgi:hypothetical protein